jgi:hypothetical protein
VFSFSWKEVLEQQEQEECNDDEDNDQEEDEDDYFSLPNEMRSDGKTIY